ncbi:MAG: efflux RND transporter periplasmic adaptor subunit [Thermodesulfobacteriota bacterium]
MCALPRDWAAALAICALSLIFQGCAQKPPFEKPPIPVKVIAVEPAESEAGLRYSATLAPREQVNLAFKVGGYVDAILQPAGPDGKIHDLQKGDRVAKGTVLARLRDSDYLAKLNHARSALEEARASLAQATREFDRAERLLEQNVVAKDLFDKAKEKLDVTKARAKGAESQVEEATIQLQDTVLRSPLDSLVVDRFLERGTLVAPGTRAFVLADLGSVKAVFGVPDYLLREVKRGDALKVSVEALHNREFRGFVTAVSPSADPRSRVFQVEITVDNPGLQLKDGMIASVQLGGSTADNPLPVVPLNAVVRPPGDPHGYMVFTIAQDSGKQRAAGRRVAIGKVFANKVAVTDGLKVGEKVITLGATIVSEGAHVAIIP